MRTFFEGVGGGKSSFRRRKIGSRLSRRSKRLSPSLFCQAGKASRTLKKVSVMAPYLDDRKLFSRPDLAIPSRAKRFDRCRTSASRFDPLTLASGAKCHTAQAAGDQNTNCHRCRVDRKQSAKTPLQTAGRLSMKTAASKVRLADWISLCSRRLFSQNRKPFNETSPQSLLLFHISENPVNCSLGSSPSSPHRLRHQMNLRHSNAAQVA